MEGFEKHFWQEEGFWANWSLKSLELAVALWNEKKRGRREPPTGHSRNSIYDQSLYFRLFSSVSWSTSYATLRSSERRNQREYPPDQIPYPLPTYKVITTLFSHSSTKLQSKQVLIQSQGEDGETADDSSYTPNPADDLTFKYRTLAVHLPRESWTLRNLIDARRFFYTQKSWGRDWLKVEDSDEWC